MKKPRHEPTYKDAVCGMFLSQKTAAATFDYDGRTYHFCADLCREKFEKAPERYIRTRKRRPEQKPTPS